MVVNDYCLGLIIHKVHLYSIIDELSNYFMVGLKSLDDLYELHRHFTDHFLDKLQEHDPNDPMVLVYVQN